MLPYLTLRILRPLWSCSTTTVIMLPYLTLRILWPLWLWCPALHSAYYDHCGEEQKPTAHCLSVYCFLQTSFRRSEVSSPSKPVLSEEGGVSKRLLELCSSKQYCPFTLIHFTVFVYTERTYRSSLSILNIDFFAAWIAPWLIVTDRVTWCSSISILNIDFFEAWIAPGLIITDHVTWCST